MDSIQYFFEYITENKAQILSLLLEHIRLTAISVGLAIIIGVPLGIIVCYIKKLNKPILISANIVQAIPSMALLGFMIPILGIGPVPAIVTVILYSLLPIIKNTYIGISNISPQTLEAAKGIGLTKAQILAKIQIPIALPVIMGGIRISSVTAVGLMTLAAFIGAGGLGHLVFSGIRTVNNVQILAGAIPACILALLVDALAAFIEKQVTPPSLRKDFASAKKTKIPTKMLLLAVILVSTLAIGFSFIKDDKIKGDVIVVGSKDFTEQVILANLVSDVIEDKTDISVDRKFDLGGTQVCFSSINNGAIDMYVEYTGTAYTDLLKYKPITDTQEVFDVVKQEMKDKYNLELLSQSDFNNTYVLAVTDETQKKYNLKTTSDLAKVSGDLKSGTTFEFLNRQDGLPGLKELYGINFKQELSLDGSPRYTALINDEVQVVDAFTTDGLLKRFKLATLEDDKNFFPPYHAAPLVRDEVLEQYPEIEPILADLYDQLTTEVMTELNYKVDELKQSPEKVAADFLVEQGIVNK